MPRGGARKGAGRPARYACGSVSITLTIPADYARAVSGDPTKLRRRLLKLLRKSRGDRPWDNPASASSSQDSGRKSADRQ